LRHFVEFLGMIIHKPYFRLVKLWNSNYLIAHWRTYYVIFCQNNISQSQCLYVLTCGVNRLLYLNDSISFDSVNSVTTVSMSKKIYDRSDYMRYHALPVPHNRKGKIIDTVPRAHEQMEEAHEIFKILCYTYFSILRRKCIRPRSNLIRVYT